MQRGEVTMAKKVLIVEDYDDVRAMMKFMVRRFGYEVIEARDGYEAVARAKQTKPDLILMDLAMPLLDGLTATMLIRKSAGFENVPIVALSAYGDLNETRAINAGCDVVLTKPLNFGTFEKFLSKILDNQPPPSKTGDRPFKN
jgi:CheY-like chemotaxis protein